MASKLNSIKLKNLPNKTHSSFDRQTVWNIEETGAKTLRIEEQFPRFKSLVQKEDDIMERVKMSEFTVPLHEKDGEIDDIYMGMTAINKAYIPHPDKTISQAAIRLDILFSNTYGNITILPILQQMTSTHNILQELQGKYLEDTKTVKIDDFVVRLAACYKEQEDLIKVRTKESAAKDNTVMRDLRTLIDTEYRGMGERINALAILDPTPEIELFIRTQNEIIKKHGGSRGAGSTGGTTAQNDNEPVDYPDAPEWLEDLPFMGVENGDIYYIMVDGKKVFYKLIDKQKFFWHPESERAAGGWEKLN